MKHVIVTRLALGMALPNSFGRRVGLLINTLFPSLAAQTETGFRWVIATDATIDAESEERVREAIRPYPHFALVKIDTFEHGFLPLVSLVEQALGSLQNVAVTRIDDDDAVATTFVAEIQAALSGVEGLAAVSCRRGVLLGPTTDRVAAVDNPGTSAGMTALTPDVTDMHCYRVSHVRFHEKVASIGGRSIVIDSDEPMWMQVLYPFSDSRELARADRIERALRHSQPASAELFARFALPPNLSSTLCKVVADTPDERAKLVFADMKRLGVKSELLKVAVRLRSAREQTAPDSRKRSEIEVQLQALRGAYYAF